MTISLQQAQAAVIRVRDAMWKRGLRHCVCDGCQQPILAKRNLPRESCRFCRRVRLIAKVYSTPATTPIGRPRRRFR